MLIFNNCFDYFKVIFFYCIGHKKYLRIVNKIKSTLSEREKMSFYLVKSRISVLFEVTLIPYVNNPNVRTILQKTKLLKRQDKQFLNKKSRFKLKGGQTTTRYN